MFAQSHSSLVEVFGLSFEESIPKLLVHKNSLDNVFLTDIKHHGESWFLCGGRVPKTHCFFNRGGRSAASDLLFYVEMGRQASIAISHSFFNLSFDHAFVFDQSEITLLEPTWRSTKQRRRDCIAIEVKIREKEWRPNGAISRLVADYAYYDDEEQFLSAKGAWSMQTAALFQRLRRLSNRSALAGHENESSGPAVTASSCDSKVEPNAVISPPERNGSGADFTARLIVDPNHPFFFDHPCDHVPGMLLIEGCGQLAGQAVAQLSGKSLNDLLLHRSGLHFMQFAECHLPIKMKAHCNPPERGKNQLLRQTVDISISQEETVLGKAAVSVAHL